MADVELFLRKTAEKEAEAKSRLQVPADLLVLTRFKGPERWRQAAVNSVPSAFSFLSRRCWTGPNALRGTYCCSVRTTSCPPSRSPTHRRSHLDLDQGWTTDQLMTSATSCRKPLGTGWRKLFICSFLLFKRSGCRSDYVSDSMFVFQRCCSISGSSGLGEQLQTCHCRYLGPFKNCWSRSHWPPNDHNQSPHKKLFKTVSQERQNKD